MKKEKAFWTVVVAVVVVLAILLSLNHFYVDYLWFSEMELSQRLFKELITKAQIGAPVFVLLVLLFFYLKFLKRFRNYRPVTWVHQAVRTNGKNHWCSTVSGGSGCNYRFYSEQPVV